jgi:hypothetical protein
MEEEGTTGLFSLFCLIGIEEMEKDFSLIRVCIIPFRILFVMRIPQEQTIAASALAAIIVFSGLLFRSFGRDKTKYGK